VAQVPAPVCRDLRFNPEIPALLPLLSRLPNSVSKIEPLFCGVMKVFSHR
jgi:hypothetical protein